MSKKLLLFLSIIIVFSLASCKVEEGFVPGTITFRGAVEVHDLSDNYDATETTLNTYTFDNDDYFSYVNIEEFIEFLNAGLLSYEITKEEDLELRYVHYIKPDLREVVGKSFYEYIINIDADENTVYLNDFDILTRLNFGYSVSENDHIELVDVIENNIDPEITIDLDDYDFDIVEENDRYYIPLYLANLFFTGASLNFYEINDDVYFFDYGANIDDLSAYYQDTSYNYKEVNDANSRYLDLYFDYFYGLKDFKEIDSFVSYIDNYDLEVTTSLETYYDQMNLFFESLDDLHTRVIDEGYLLGDYEVEPNYNEDTKLYLYSAASYTNKCSDYDESFYYEYIDGSHYFNIVNFESNTAELFYTHAQYIQQDEEVIIDLACNTGGSLQGVVELLVYLTNEDIPVRHMNSLTGRITEEFYSGTSDVAIDANFTVITSNVTYSAANVFVSVVKDLEIATVIGEQTLGGACALIFTVLPNGSIISNSSYMTFISEDYEIQDDGIYEDLRYRLPVNLEELVSKLDSPFELGTSYVFNNRYLSSRARTQLDIIYQDSDIEIEEYKVYIYNAVGALTYTASYTDEFFDLYEFPNNMSSYAIEVEVEYYYKDTLYQETIFFNEYN